LKLIHFFNELPTERGGFSVYKPKKIERLENKNSQRFHRKKEIIPSQKYEMLLKEKPN
jgi:hypothetical protein